MEYQSDILYPISNQINFDIFVPWYKTAAVVLIDKTKGVKEFVRGLSILQ